MKINQQAFQKFWEVFSRFWEFFAYLISSGKKTYNPDIILEAFWIFLECKGDLAVCASFYIQLNDFIV